MLGDMKMLPAQLCAGLTTPTGDTDVSVETYMNRRPSGPKPTSESPWPGHGVLLPALGRSDVLGGGGQAPRMTQPEPDHPLRLPAHPDLRTKACPGHQNIPAGVALTQIRTEVLSLQMLSVWLKRRPQVALQCRMIGQ